MRRRFILFALLVVGCTRQPGPPTGWGVGSDGGAGGPGVPGPTSDQSGAPAAPDAAPAVPDAGAGGAREEGQATPPRAPVPDAAADLLDPKTFGPAPGSVIDGGGDAEGDGRTCPETGRCD